MKKLLIAVLLVIVIYIGAFSFGGSIAQHNQFLSRIWGTVFYPFRLTLTCSPKVYHETGKMEQLKSGYCSLDYLKSKVEPGDHIPVGGIEFRVPSTLSNAVIASKGKIVLAIIDTEPDPVEFNSQHFVLRSFTPVN